MKEILGVTRNGWLTVKTVLIDVVHLPSQVHLVEVGQAGLGGVLRELEGDVVGSSG